MIRTLNRKSLETMRDGFKGGAEFAMKRARRVEFRAPWVYRKPLVPDTGRKPWLMAIMFFSSVMAIIGGILYFRKRKQVADRYTMGEEDRESWAAGTREESLAPTTP